MPRLRIVRITTVAAALVLAATPLGPVGPASAQASAKKVAITVVGISRAGQQVTVATPDIASLTPSDNPNPLGDGPTYHVVPGRYFISGDVPTPTSDPNVVNQTLVVRHVDVRTSETITLDSRGGKLITVWLDGKNVSQDAGGTLTGATCNPRGFGGTYSSLSGPIYVKPTRIAGVSFVWGWESAPLPATQYELNGLTNNGLPAHPVYRLRTSELDKTVIQLRGGTEAGTHGTLGSFGGVSRYCGIGGGTWTAREPSSISVYRSPGTWETTLNSFLGPRQCGYDSLVTAEKPGHSYTVPFGAAVRGPWGTVPTVANDKLTYDSQNQFVEGQPHAQSIDYCFQATVKLASGGHVIAKQEGGPFHLLTAKLHPGRWYELTTNAWQSPAGHSPGGMLSSRSTLAWRFKVPKHVIEEALPVAVTSLVPGGLNLLNRAAPGSTTPVRAFFTQSQGPVPPKPVAVRSFTAQASFDNGKTWHGVAVVQHKGYWTFAVRNPRSGFVALRTTTVNALGFSSVETIDRAYGIR